MAGALLLLAAGCGAGRRAAVETVDRVIGAVQERDLAALYCLLAGASTQEDLGRDEASRREAFAAWARSRYEAHEAGRDAGFVELDDPIGTVKLFALGRGTFYSRELVRSPREGVVTLDTRLTFGYRAVDLSRLSPGTTFYVNAPPPGRVHAVRVPAVPREVSLEVLDSLELVWTLVEEPAGGGCPAGWRVASVEPVPDSVTSVDLTWMF